MKTPEELNYLINRSYSQYQKAASDRSKLHKLEWDSDDSFSVLGEAEVWSDDIVGAITRIHKPSEASFVLNILKSSQHDSHSVLGTWIRTDASKFPEFSSYLRMTETIRISGLEYLRTRTLKLHQ